MIIFGSLLLTLFLVGFIFLTSILFGFLGHALKSLVPATMFWLGYSVFAVLVFGLPGLAWWNFYLGWMGVTYVWKKILKPILRK